LVSYFIISFETLKQQKNFLYRPRHTQLVKPENSERMRRSRIIPLERIINWSMEPGFDQHSLIHRHVLKLC